MSWGNLYFGLFFYVLKDDPCVWQSQLTNMLTGFVPMPTPATALFVKASFVSSFILDFPCPKTKTSWTIDMPVEDERMTL